MAISDADIKRLWGRAAGVCSRPGCGTDCVPLLDGNDPVVIGEMAHVIAQKTRGPRGEGDGGADGYDNRILLCPTCHTLVDKSQEGTYPAEMLHEWKRRHEEERDRARVAPVTDSRRDLANRVSRLLAENYATWRQYGPESEAARSNPISGVAKVWEIRKITQVIPRNTQIVRLLETNASLLSPDEYATCRLFVEHAAGFEASAYRRLEDVPKFPIDFEEMMRRVSAE